MSKMALPNLELNPECEMYALNSSDIVFHPEQFSDTISISDVNVLPYEQYLHLVYEDQGLMCETDKSLGLIIPRTEDIFLHEDINIQNDTKVVQKASKLDADNHNSQSNINTSELGSNIPVKDVPEQLITKNIEKVHTTKNKHTEKPFGWISKQVQIKTMSGKFNVKMWTSCPSDNSEEQIPKPRSNYELMKANNKQNHLQNFKTSQEPPPDIKNKTIPCPHTGCKKIFKNNAALRKHMRSHGPRNHICAICGNGFVERSKLKRHYLVHTGEKPFECPFEGCNKRFSLNFNLRSHIRIHTGYKPHACPYDGCMKRFCQSTNLKSHILTHVQTKLQLQKRNNNRIRKSG